MPEPLAPGINYGYIRRGKSPTIALRLQCGVIVKLVVYLIVASVSFRLLAYVLLWIVALIPGQLRQPFPTARDLGKP